jgi:hypothetical protein
VTTPPPARANLRSPAAGILAALALIASILAAACQLPGQKSMEISAENPSALLERCAEAARAMHFDVKAIDKSHLIVVADGKVEGALRFHTIHLSIKVIHLAGTGYRVEAIATSDERGIRAGAERKARRLFFRELEKRGG